MKFKMLNKSDRHISQINWLNPSSLRESKANRLEVGFVGVSANSQAFSDWIYDLFQPYLADCIVSNRGEWGDFCLELDEDLMISNPAEYEKSALLIAAYDEILRSSLVERAYDGDCVCNDWKTFLDITVACTIERLALYSPIIYSPALGIAFYFHYSYSIGFFYTDDSSVAAQILMKIREIQAS